MFYDAGIKSLDEGFLHSFDTSTDYMHLSPEGTRMKTELGRWSSSHIPTFLMII